VAIITVRECCECGGSYVREEYCPCCGYTQESIDLGDVCLECYIMLLQLEVDEKLNEVFSILSEVDDINTILEEIL